MWKVTFRLSRPPRFLEHTRREIVNCPTPQDAEAWVREFYSDEFGFQIKCMDIEMFNLYTNDEAELANETLIEARRLMKQQQPVKPLDNIKCHDLNIEHIWDCDYESMFDPTQNKYSCRVCHMKKEDYEARRSITTSNTGSISKRTGLSGKPGSIP